MFSSTPTFEFEREAGSAPYRRAQWFFFAYRLLVSGLLAAIFFGLEERTILGQHNATLFGVTTLLYLAFSIAEGVILSLRPRLPVLSHTLIVVSVDIVAVTCLMHASSGMASGLGMLLAVSIAFTGLLTPGLLALLAAAVSSLAMLVHQVYAELFTDDIAASYPQAGLLGASFFAIAILAHVLSRRLQESERLINQKELDLANLEQLNEHIIHSMETGILVVDEQLHIRLMNESAWRLLGRPDTRTGNPLSTASATLAQQLMSWRDDPDGNITPFSPQPNGHEVQPAFSRLGGKKGYGTVIFLEDATAVTQQAQQMKLASLGRLTASIAHEIRNPLGAISHAQQLLAESPEIAESDRRLLDIIQTHSKRVNDIIETVLHLSRRGHAHPSEIQLKEWTEHFAQEFTTANALPDDTLSTTITPSDTLVQVDPDQLRQIVANLCENALLHAMPQGGEVRIRLQGGISEETSGPHLDIIDNGRGIPEASIKQIFEPFFTTSHSGTGLGLYIARELAEINRLRLEYLPKPEAGACFRISFPSYRNLKRR